MKKPLPRYTIDRGKIEVRCGKKMFRVTANDVIMEDYGQYYIVTKYLKRFDKQSGYPMVDNAVINDLLKEDLLIAFKPVNPKFPFDETEYKLGKYYRLAEHAVEGLQYLIENTEKSGENFEI